MQIAHTPRVGAPLRRVTVAFGVAVAVLLGPGSANASGIAVLPALPSYVATGIAAVETYANGVTVGQAVATVGVTGAGVVAAPVAPLILAGARLVYLGWQLGGVLGDVLPCLDCPPPTGGNDVASGATVSVSMDAYPTISVQVTGRTASSPCDSNCYGDPAGNGAGFYFDWATTPAANASAVSDSNRYFVSAKYSDGFDAGLGSCGILGYGSAAPQCAAVHNGSPLASATLKTFGQVLKGTWYYAAPLPPAGYAPSGEALTVQSTTTYRNADGSTGTLVTRGPSFLAAAPSFPPITVPALQPGQTRIGFGATVVPLSPTSPVKATTIVPPMTLPTTTSPDHPEESVCLPGGAEYPCLLSLLRILPDGTTRPYDISIDYNGGSAPVGAFRCTFGSLLEPVTECRPIYQQVPVKDGTATPLPGEPVGDGGNCVGSGVTFNPISWVYVPVKCALQWAFVPGSATSAAVAATSANFRTRVPVSWLLETSNFVGTALGGATSPASGCLRFDVDLARLGRYHILDSCNEAEPIVHAVRGLRTITGAAELLAFLGPLCWWAWKSYAPLATPNG